MNLTFINVITGVFLVGALVLSLGSHKMHCDIAKKLGVVCSPHSYHLITGVVLFLSTVVLIHREHLSQYVPILKKLK